MGQLIASLFGIAMPEVQEPENAAMCVSASIDAIAMPETVDTNIQAHSKADLSGFAMPSAQEPLSIAAFADGNLDAEAMPHSSDTVHGAGSASGELQCIAYPNSYGLVFTSGLASGELTGIGLGSTAETVHPTGIASGKLSGALLPAIADVSNIQMAAAGEMEGAASPQQQEPEQTTMGTTAELVCSACPVALKIYTVTFVYDGEELYTAKVLEGYDCPDPVAEGATEAPTKEMTAQYTYEFSGWSLTDGGEADADALANITEDTVVYPAFKESIRYYIVRFYDGDTLVDSVSVPYGGTAETSYVKTGYKATWVPSNENIIGNTDCYGQFGEFTFASATWEEIAEVSESGLASSYFSVGDAKTVPITYSDGTTGSIVVAIAGFDHDDLATGTGKAGISIVCKTLPEYTTLWSSSRSGATYANSLVNAALQRNGDIWNMLPSELTAVIKNVNKQYDTSYSYGTSPSLATLTAPLWALSTYEFGVSESSHSSYAPGGSSASKLGKKYELYDTVSITSTKAQTSFLYFATEDGATCNTWTRTLRRVGECQLYYMYTGTSSSGYYKYIYCDMQTNSLDTTSRRVCFGFCI